MKTTRYLFFSAVFVVVFLPEMAAASPFVTCSGVDCSACDLASMGNEILKWLIGMLFIVFAAIAAVGGFGLVTSAGNVEAKSAAKSKLTNAIIGIVIVLAAWLLVDTVMKGLLAGGTGDIAGYGPWSSVKCQEQVSPGFIAPTGAFSYQAYVHDTTNNCKIPKAGSFADEANCDAALLGIGGDMYVVKGCDGSSDSPPTWSTLPICGGVCSVTTLSPITDALARQMESGQKVIWTNTNPALKPCVDKFIGQVGGSVTSAYRPPAYQTHLYEVSTKACELSKITDGSCDAVRGPIEADFRNHGLPLCGAVAQNSSTHSSGIGVDISGVNNSSPSVQAAANSSCLIWKNYPNDPYHYDLKSGCTCN